ncbi:MAG: acetate--CoA ligase family protein [Candidatus Eisenbacteria bacterium]|nr:acetate--CoA ligase family protein [Candidatus Eisenbacteria bacterium]
MPPTMNTLDPFFTPRGVVVVGASRDEGKLGYGVVRNLVESGFRGAMHFVNPKADQILGHPCWRSISDVPDPADLAVIIVPAEKVPEVLEQCGARGIRGAIVVSGGFGETDAHGRQLERRSLEISRRHGIRLIGPNCIGVIHTHLPVNTTFLISKPVRGDVAFVSQSGAICQAVIDWGAGMGFGFSYVASLGNQADVSEHEMLGALARDERTRVITMYLEGVKDGVAFLRAAELASRAKPLVALKVGRTAAGRKAVSSHTGALAGQAAAYVAAFERSGVLRAGSVEDLFGWAKALAWSPPMKGDRVAVLTNAGGPGILAADSIEDFGLKLASLAEPTVQAMRAVAHPHAALHNPVDMLASGGPADYARFLPPLLADPGVDAVLVISVPPPIGDQAPVAEAVVAATRHAGKPVVVAVMGDATVGDTLRVLRAAHIPDYKFPEHAASALAALHKRQAFLDRPPHRAPVLEGVNAPAVGRLLRDAPGELLLGTAATEVVAAYGLRGPAETLARTADEAAAWAAKNGFPVAIKVASADISHKSDVGGVVLGVADEAAAREAFRRVTEAGRKAVPAAHIDGATVQRMVLTGQEVIVGAVRDEQFGALAMFGAGGVEVEGAKDVAFGLCPLSRGEAEAMIDATFAGRRLRGFRNIAPADREAALDALLRLSRLAADFPEISEMEVNPLRVQRPGEGAVAVDVRVKLAGAKAGEPPAEAETVGSAPVAGKTARGAPLASK